jgi:hydroxyethylthiazole kinase-like sugar kinase family protein
MEHLTIVTTFHANAILAMSGVPLLSYAKETVQFLRRQIQQDTTTNTVHVCVVRAFISTIHWLLVLPM